MLDKRHYKQRTPLSNKNISGAKDTSVLMVLFLELPLYAILMLLR